MAKYRVSYPFTVWASVEVEAEDDDTALDAAANAMGSPTCFSGNGGSNRLVGCAGETALEPSEFDFDKGDVEEVA